MGSVKGASTRNHLTGTWKCLMVSQYLISSMPLYRCTTSQNHTFKIRTLARTPSLGPRFQTLAVTFQILSPMWEEKVQVSRQHEMRCWEPSIRKELRKETRPRLEASPPRITPAFQACLATYRGLVNPSWFLAEFPAWGGTSLLLRRQTQDFKCVYVFGSCSLALAILEFVPSSRLGLVTILLPTRCWDTEMCHHPHSVGRSSL
ncbi:uncharacterized protein LOC116088702 [Mastomys coucha]|uniref:uncharacterized protein LOC116088702 n=1 Tax=Mastomys coucha TaxID=35658 RepID=UPI001261E395|nr:uncharacterized protein LOC116088702 [Mastomys coucha]